jgi:hypothetical protein
MPAIWFAISGHAGAPQQHRQLRELLARNRCSICGGEFPHNTPSTGGIDAHGNPTIACACCADLIAEPCAVGIACDRFFEHLQPHPGFNLSIGEATGVIADYQAAIAATDQQVAAIEERLGAQVSGVRLLQEGPQGLRFDFCAGCRISVPENGHSWKVRLTDLDTGNTLFETELKSGRVNSCEAPSPKEKLRASRVASAKRWFIPFCIEAWQNGKAVFSHDYCARGRDVLIQFPGKALGDTIAWFSYCPKFAEKHGCKLTCVDGA